MRCKSLLAAVAATMMGLGPQAYAHSPMEKPEAGDLAGLVEKSNLVFIGKAEKVGYRNARGENGEGLIPYTIVTYRIGKVLRGKAPGREITLRIVGGADGSGRFLTATGVPIVQEGDQDMLFVGDSGDPACPLVNCEHGRFRILNERVYDAHGSPVREIRKAKVISRGVPPRPFQVVRFPAPKFDDLMRNPEVAERLKAQGMPADEARRLYEAQAPRFVEFSDGYPEPKELDDGQNGEREAATTRPETFVALPLGTFVAEIGRLAALAKRKPDEVKSIDPEAQIVVARVNVTAPREPRPETRDGEDEIKAYEQNAFNPVIPR